MSNSSDATHPAPVVALNDVHMAFGPVQALSGASLTIHPGECIGLVGHNGAGKSTFVNVVNGRLTPTDGSVTYLGTSNPAQDQTQNNTLAHRAGIRSVFQELSLCPNLTVLENLRIPYTNMPRRNWRRQARALVIDALDEVFPDHGISASSLVGDLTIAQRQMVEIAIAFSKRDQDARLVILDEPTSSLDVSIARQLLRHIRKYCDAGGAVIFISHMLGEVFEVASRIVVMKDGQITKDEETAGFTHDTLVDAMGHVVPEGEAENAALSRTFGAEVARLPGGLSAREGEIVGLAGLAGHGQAEALARFFVSRSSKWRAGATPDVVFIAGDRARDGVFPLWSILKNLSIATLKEFSRSSVVHRSAENALAQDWRQRISIRTDNLSDPILSLSGGNQQKVLFARALASTAPIVVMDDPMRGVDVGTKKEVYRMIRAEAATGRTFLWYSTETDEILECDRVFVFRNGEISAELTGEDITAENMLRASFEMQEVTA